MKNRKETMERRSLIVIIAENVFESFSLSFLIIDISFVPERLKPKSLIKLKYAINAAAKLIKPYFAGPSTRTTYGSTINGNK